MNLQTIQLLLIAQSEELDIPWLRVSLAALVALLFAVGLGTGVKKLTEYNLKCLEREKSSFFSTEIGFSIMLKYLTVCLLIDAIMILGILGILDGNTLGTLIGGIAGYVLGNLTHRGQHPKEVCEESADGQSAGPHQGA